MSSNMPNEQAPLLPSSNLTPPDRSPASTQARPSLSSKLHAFLNQDIALTSAHLPLLALYLVTGLLDSASISIWQSFVSMQTGNTVYFGLGLTDPAGTAAGGSRWIKAGVSIAAFCAGAFAFARLHGVLATRGDGGRAGGEGAGLGRRRWVVLVALAVQLGCVVGAAVVVHVERARGEVGRAGELLVKRELRWQVLVPIALVAVQAAGQGVTSRVLKVNALSSVVLTSIYLDTFADLDLFAPWSRNRSRNKRILAPVCLLAGVIGGGLCAKSELGMVLALWIAVALKMIIVIGAVTAK